MERETWKGKGVQVQGHGPTRRVALWSPPPRSRGHACPSPTFYTHHLSSPPQSPLVLPHPTSALPPPASPTLCTAKSPCSPPVSEVRLPALLIIGLWLNYALQLRHSKTPSDDVFEKLLMLSCFFFRVLASLARPWWPRRWRSRRRCLCPPWWTRWRRPSLVFCSRQSSSSASGHSSPPASWPVPPSTTSPIRATLSPTR